MSTIFALATANGKAGVAVVRISGPQAFDAAGSLCSSLPEIRVAGLRKIMGHDGTLLDEALVLTFDKEASFTGEDVVEFQLHGSTSVVHAVLSELGKIDGLRMAEPGEFTRRAFENGQMDLAQVEGLADLLDAETEAQRRQSLKILSGALGKLADGWRAKLIRSAALLEATIDFADEEVPVDVTPEVSSLLHDVSVDLEREITGTQLAERIRTGFEIAILGPPNAGKSTLLNALAGREAAITSDIAGTTRDVIEVRMDLDGLPVTLLDTAGLRETDDAIEEIGVERAISRAKAADLRVFLQVDGDSFYALEPTGDDIVVAAKCDIFPSAQLGISGTTGAGIDELIHTLSAHLASKVVAVGTATRERHRYEMVRANEALSRAFEELSFGPDRYELASEELRSAVRALDSLVGRIDVEVILDEIFSSFCLGK